MYHKGKKGGEFIMNQEYAGFGIRLLAWLIDTILLSIVGGVLAGILVVTGTTRGTENIVGYTNVLSNLLSLIISFVYFVFLQAKYGQTLGKKVMNIKVVTASGGTPSMLTFFLREIIGKFISALIIMIGYLMVLWDPKKQALHDKIAGTYVVKIRNKVQQPVQNQPLPAQPVQGN